MKIDDFAVASMNGRDERSLIDESSLQMHSQAVEIEKQR